MLTKNEIIGVCSAVAAVILIIMFVSFTRDGKQEQQFKSLAPVKNLYPSFVELGSFSEYFNQRFVQKFNEFIPTDGQDENGKNIKKVYYHSKHLKATWTVAASICNSYGLQFVSFETEHESEEFLKICTKNNSYFDNSAHIGGIGSQPNSESGLFWMNSGKKINYGLLFIMDQHFDPHMGNSFCLSIVKETYRNAFHFSGVGCSKMKAHFICQILQ